MARIFIDGFETGNANLWDLPLGSPAASTVWKESGNYSMKISVGAVGKALSASSKLYVAGSYVQSTAFSYGGGFLVFRDGTAIIGQIGFSTVTSQLRYMRGSTIISTGAAVLSTAVAYRIETFLQVSSDVGVGRCIVKINGTTDIDFTGITQPGATTQFNSLYTGATGSVGPFSFVDNVVLDDATWIGNTKIIALSPSASGASTGWAPSAGENYACVDEVPITTADYVSVNTASALDLYNLPSVISSATSIQSIQVSIVHEVEGAPTPTKTQIAIQHNSTQAFSSSLTPGAAGSPAYGTKLWDTNPVSGSSWTVSDINSLQIGIKSATA